jgi:flagellar hook-associated protein 2
VVDQTDGDHSGSVRVKQGKIGQLAEAISDMTADETGTLAILIRSYEQGIDDLDDRIYYESARLDALETKLTSQYATLDETLSYYTNLESSLSSLVESLSSD